MGRRPEYGERRRLTIMLPEDVADRMDYEAEKREVARNKVYEWAVIAWLRGAERETPDDDSDLIRGAHDLMGNDE